jgi:septal ring factor EnvC (AmiA/AmiB activator)
MNPAMPNNPFVQVALPIMFTILIAAWINDKDFDGVNRRIDDQRSNMNERFGEVNRRLDRIDDTLKTHSAQIASLEERVSPLGRRRPPATRTVPYPCRPARV